MSVLNQYSIPYRGMGIGIHNLKFDVDSSFLGAFESSHLTNGQFEILVELEKKHDSSVLVFDVKGYTKTQCDRCMEDINLPLLGRYTMHIKMSEEGESNDEILYVHPETSVINLAQLIYEYILLSMPITKVYDCENDEDPPCNDEVLDRLEYDLDIDDEQNDPHGGSIWDSLKGLDLKDQ